MKHVILLFLDGVGFGADNAANPFFQSRPAYLPLFSSGARLPGGLPIGIIETSCNLDGIPQSATCQTALFTGCAGEALGSTHRQGYPDIRLRKLLFQSNLLSTLQRRGFTSRFLNAYPYHAPFFQDPHLRLEADGKLTFSAEFPRHWQKMISVTTCLMLSINQTPADETDIRDRNALYQDFSNQSLRQRGADLPVFTPEEAGEILFRASRSSHFLLYEYFQTDLCAHRRPVSECIELIEDLNRMIQALIGWLDPQRDTLIITSDHGNLESLDISGHTRNPVPFIVWGQGHDDLIGRVSRLEEVTPALVNWFTES